MCESFFRTGGAVALERNDHGFRDLVARRRTAMSITGGNEATCRYDDCERGMNDEAAVFAALEVKCRHVHRG